MAAGGLHESTHYVRAMSAESPSPLRTCESCGREDSDLQRVHRIYVTPEAWDTEGKTEVLDEVETWCFSCRTHYPHQEITP